MTYCPHDPPKECCGRPRDDVCFCNLTTVEQVDEQRRLFMLWAAHAEQRGVSDETWREVLRTAARRLEEREQQLCEPGEEQP